MANNFQRVRVTKLHDNAVNVVNIGVDGNRSHGPSIFRWSLMSANLSTYAQRDFTASNVTQTFTNDANTRTRLMNNLNYAYIYIHVYVKVRVSSVP